MVLYETDIKKINNEIKKCGDKREELEDDLKKVNERIYVTYDKVYGMPMEREESDEEMAFSEEEQEVLKPEDQLVQAGVETGQPSALTQEVDEADLAVEDEPATKEPELV